MRGDLRESNLAEVMRHLYAERKSGTLLVSRQNIRKRIHLKKGVAIFADAGDGQVQTREEAELLAYSLFTWTSGEYAFEEGDPDIDDSLAFEGSPSTVILEGSRRIDEVEILERLIGGRETVFTCTKTSVLPLFKMKLSPAENAILTFAREREQFSQAELPLPSGDVAIVNALNALVAVGLLKIVKKADAPEPVPVAAPAPPRPAPTPPAPAAAAPPPTPAPAAPAPPPPAAAPAPAAMPVANVPPPAPEPAPQTSDVATSVPSDMEQLLNTYEAKRSGLRPPKPVAPTPPRAAEQPVQAAPPPPEPPIIEGDVSPETTLSDLVPAPASAPAPPQPVVETAPASTAEPEPPAPPRPSLELVAAWKSAILERLPEGKARLILIAGGSIALVSLVSILWLTSGSDQASPSAAVVAADAASAVETASPAPRPEPELVPEPEPSEAELFYRANLAFESGAFEQSKEELTKLLELKPDLTAARELMTRVERELAPKPKPRPRRVVQKPAPKPEPKPEPAPPTPNELFAAARAALNRGGLEEAQVKLDELETLNRRYPGARELESELSDRFWERKLPLVFSARHDHALGGCDGVLTLTSQGYGYRSDDHEWFWSFGEVAETDRRGARRLRVETNGGKSYNFELRDALSSDDWARYQRLSSR